MSHWQNMDMDLLAWMIRAEGNKLRIAAKSFYDGESEHDLEVYDILTEADDALHEFAKRLEDLKYKRIVEKGTRRV